MVQVQVSTVEADQAEWRNQVAEPSAQCQQGGARKKVMESRRQEHCVAEGVAQAIVKAMRASKGSQVMKNGI